MKKRRRKRTKDKIGVRISGGGGRRQRMGAGRGEREEDDNGEILCELELDRGHWQQLKTEMNKCKQRIMFVCQRCRCVCLRTYVCACVGGRFVFVPRCFQVRGAALLRSLTGSVNVIGSTATN